VTAAISDPVNGTGRELTVSQALNEALLQEMRRDPAVFVMGEDVGASEGLFGVTRGLQHQFGAGRSSARSSASRRATLTSGQRYHQAGSLVRQQSSSAEGQERKCGGGGDE